MFAASSVANGGAVDLVLYVCWASIDQNNGCEERTHAHAHARSNRSPLFTLHPPPARVADVHDSEARRACRGRTVLRYSVPRHKVEFLGTILGRRCSKLPKRTSGLDYRITRAIGSHNPWDLRADSLPALVCILNENGGFRSCRRNII